MIDDDFFFFRANRVFLPLNVHWGERHPIISATEPLLWKITAFPAAVGLVPSYRLACGGNVRRKSLRVVLIGRWRRRQSLKHPAWLSKGQRDARCCCALLSAQGWSPPSPEAWDPEMNGGVASENGLIPRRRCASLGRQRCLDLSFIESEQSMVGSPTPIIPKQSVWVNHGSHSPGPGLI